MMMEKRLILEALKKELEQEVRETGDSQWLMAVAVALFQPTERPVSLEGEQPTHTARVILKTKSSPFVDGTDIPFTVNLDNKTADCSRWADLWAEYEPIFHGCPPSKSSSERKFHIDVKKTNQLALTTS